MLLRYFFDDKLAQASYFVGCQQTGEAIVVDPARDIQPYIETAEAEDMRIVAASETHIHADFVSGSRELAERLDTTLFLSDCGDEAWKYDYARHYPHRLLGDGDTFMVGNLRFEVLHTPGHTPEHISLLLTDTLAADQPMGIFTGDFVFVGDIGRPDLLEKAAGLLETAERGARQMYHSLQRFRELPDYLQVWPGHGAGSACGKDLGAVPSSTVGYEKRFNWAFNAGDEALFVQQLLAGQPEPPRYFAVMKRVNKEGPAVIGNLLIPQELPVEGLNSLLEEGFTVVDTRSWNRFAESHISGTINIPKESSFTTYAGWLLDYDHPYYLIAEQQHLAEITRYLSSIGLDNCGGYFESASTLAWFSSHGPMASYLVLQPQEAAGKLENENMILLDVRSQNEWQEGHIAGARHIMLGYLTEQASSLPKDQPIIVQCRLGTRSAIAASLLQRMGFKDLLNLDGGITAWQNAGLPVMDAQS